MELSIILPCYNEKINVANIIKSLPDLENNNLAFELILVDNGSSDGSYEFIKESMLNNNNKNLRLVRIDKNIGYGNGILQGVNNSKGEVISWTHADMQTDINDIFKSYMLHKEKLLTSKVIIKGKRMNRNTLDNFFTFSMSIMSNVLLKVRLNDINAQPKIFNRKFIKYLRNAPKDFSLDLFLLYIAQINNYMIINYPVFFNKRLHGTAKGGGTFSGKIKLIMRTIKYIYKLRKDIKYGIYNS